MKTRWRPALLVAALVAVAVAAVSGAQLISFGEAVGPPPPDHAAPALSQKPPTRGWAMTSEPELRLVDQSEGIAFEHSRYQRYVNGLPIEGAFVTEHIDKRTNAVVSVTERPVKLPPTLAVQAPVEVRQAEQIAKQQVGLVAARGDIDSQLVYLPLGDELQLAWKTTLPALEPLGDWLVYVDALDGKVLKVQDLIRYECTIPPPSPGGCVFDPSPVVEQCGWAGLADNGDADSPLLTALRVGVELLGLQTSGNSLGQLIGEYADLTAPGIGGAYLPAGVCQEPSFIYDKTRSNECFEEVTTYYHVDAVQRKIQALGFTGPKAIYDSAIPVHAHYMPDPNAFYSSYDKGLHFGDGGVDFAEDGDVIVHEYGHALLDDQVPDISTYEGACIHEGFADVLSSLVFFEHNCDEACVGEWINAEAQSCLRRTDGAKHYPEDMHYWDPHEDGEIWSGAVWGLFEALGGDVAARDKVLTLILEGHFFLDPESGLRDAASAVIAADEGLYGGGDVPIIEAVFAGRGLVALPAPNDDFDDAIPVEPLSFADFHDTADATVAVDDPPISCVGGYGHSVWYRLNVPIDMVVNLDTFGSTYDTVLAVYTGTRGALTEEVCNDDSDGLQSFISLPATGGVMYHIMVASYGGGPGGTLTFHATAPLPNDNLDSAVIIAEKPFEHFLSTDAATTEDGEPQPCAGIANTVWYAFSETTDQFAQAHTFGSSFDTALAVYSGPPPGLATFDDLTLIDCNDDSGGWESKVAFSASAGVTYYFQAGGFSGMTGDLQFHLGPVTGTDVTVDKSDSADPVDIGEPFSYVLQISNVGPEEATGVALDDWLPWDVAFVAASPGCTWEPRPTPTPPPSPTPSVIPTPISTPTLALAVTPTPTPIPPPPTDGVVHCDLPDLAPGGSHFVTIDVLAPPYSARLYNDVWAQAANEPPENGDNNWDWEGTYVGEPGPSVTVYKDAWPDPVQAGELLYYFLRVTNLGTDIAVGVSLDDDLPPQVQFVSASSECTWMSMSMPPPTPMSGSSASPTPIPPTVIPPTPSGPDGVVHCDLPDLPPGIGYGVSITVLAPQETGTIWNQACVSASNEPPENQSDNCKQRDTTVTGGAACGDVDCDDDVDAVDALFILQYVVGLRSESSECPPPPGTMYLPACDVDCDYDCDAVDALFVLQHVVGIRPELCVCAQA